MRLHGPRILLFGAALVTLGVFAFVLVDRLLHPEPQGAQLTHDGEDRPRDATRPSDDPILALALTPWTGDLDGILRRGILRVAIPYGLSTYFIDGPTQRGLTYEEVMGFEPFLKRTMGKQAEKLTLVVIPTNLARVLPMLTEGRADLAAGNLAITTERRELVDFSAPFMTGVREVLITGPAAPLVQTVDDMLSSAIHVRRASSFYDGLSNLNAKRVAAGRPALPVVLANERLSTSDLIQEVAAGMIPATIVDEQVASLFAQIQPDLRIHDAISVADDRQIAWAMRKGSPRLMKAVNAYVPEAKKGSTLGNVLINRYLKNADWARNALSAQERARFQQVADLIKKYADRYGFEWQMVAAQGYQESGLDQTQRSPVGAIGVMQVMAETAKDPNVDIPDIHLLEPNIHAGVKYLAFIRDRYFTDAPITELDRTLLSLAAYNAGPAKVAQARTFARSLGLDPNVWFDNVEIAAARKVSDEPVVYVRNIYRYYLAYKLVSTGTNRVAQVSPPGS
jgi:membrane-bound lytic murein transglycosylase MltF